MDHSNGRRQELLISIAARIEARVEEQKRQHKERTGRVMGGSAVDRMNLDLWAGASMAMDASLGEGADDAVWLRGVVAFAIWPRGYSETQTIAKGKES